MGALTRKQKVQLRQDFFLPREIKGFDEAIGGDIASGHRVPQKLKFNSKPFRAMRNSRKQWVRDLKKKGWTTDQVMQQVAAYYSLKAGRNPFDFLKMEYKSLKKLTDFIDAVKRKVRSRVSRTLGRAYGRKMTPQQRPKFLPKRPLYPRSLLRWHRKK